MSYSTFDHNGKTFYVDPEGYYSLKVDHDNREFFAYRNLSHVLSLSGWHCEMLKILDIAHYKDSTCKEYVERTSDKKLKAQGFKRI